MARSFGRVLGQRKLVRAGSRGGGAVVLLGRPSKRKDGDWECPFRITTLRNSRTQYGYGVDSIQALTTALEGIRVTLEGSRERLTWIGGEPGDHGFERLVTTSFGRTFTKRLNRLIDREILRMVKLLKDRHRAAKARRGGVGARRN
jgi:hypothetical protein